MSSDTKESTEDVLDVENVEYGVLEPYQASL